MAMTPYSQSPLVISILGTTPQERGLETQQFKAKFDEGLKEFTEWFNATHKTEFELVQTDLATHLANNVTDVDGVHGLKYEEGSWTPVLKGSEIDGNNTYGFIKGRYIKINKQVWCAFNLIMSAKDSAMAGNVLISGLPFGVAEMSTGVSFGSIKVHLSANTILTGQPSDAHINLLTYTDSNGASLDSSAILNDTALNGYVLYQAYY